MNSVIVYFRDATYAEIEREVEILGIKSGSHNHYSENGVFIWKYNEDSSLNELAESEQQELFNRFGKFPSSAFQIAARNGVSARIALELVANLCSKFNPALLDDDFGNIYDHIKILSIARENTLSNIYSLEQHGS